MTGRQTDSVLSDILACHNSGVCGVRSGEIGEPEREIVAPDPRPAQVPAPKTEPSKPQPKEPQPA